MLAGTPVRSGLGVKAFAGCALGDSLSLGRLGMQFYCERW
jgi:hypothetical protein